MAALTYWLLENRLDAQHPDAPYLADNSIAEIGTLTAADGQTLYYQLFKPLHFDPAKRYPAIVDVYGGPGVQRVLDNWHGSSFTQILTRAGYVVFHARQSRQRASAALHSRRRFTTGWAMSKSPTRCRARVGWARRASWTLRASAYGAGATAAT